MERWLYEVTTSCQSVLWVLFSHLLQPFSFYCVLSEVTWVSQWNARSPHYHQIIFSSVFAVSVCRTSTSRTSRPVGVTGWLSALWCTPSSPPSLTTRLCLPPTAKKTLSWPLELQSEWYQYISMRIEEKLGGVLMAHLVECVPTSDLGSTLACCACRPRNLSPCSPVWLWLSCQIKIMEKIYICKKAVSVSLIWWMLHSWNNYIFIFNQNGLLRVNTN